MNYEVPNNKFSNWVFFTQTFSIDSEMSKKFQKVIQKPRNHKVINNKEGKMTYNKETVIGVIQQIIEMTPPEGFGVSKYSTDVLLKNAKKGLYSKLTLEEVWKEKRMEANQKGLLSFAFEFDGFVYVCHKDHKTQTWSGLMEGKML